jgi:hypothetical protein
MIISALLLRMSLRYHLSNNADTAVKPKADACILDSTEDCEVDIQRPEVESKYRSESTATSKTF